MATVTANLTENNSTDAEFRAWGSFISAALAAFGWVQTADTGQINWTTVVHPTVNGTFQGYEIWKMADALQATSPFFIKIEYGSTATSANAPACFITTGTGSNGAGTLINPSTRTVIESNGNNLTAWACYASGANNRLSLAMWLPSGNAWVVAIERSKNTAGADTGEYLNVALNSVNTPSCKFWTHLATGSVVIEPSNNIPSAAGTILASTLFGGNIALFPIAPVLGYVRPPMRGVISGKQGDWTSGDIATITLYAGLPDTYLCVRNTTSATSGTASFGFGGTLNGTIGTYCALVRYD